MPPTETEQPVREQAAADQQTTLGLTAEPAGAAEAEETGPLELEDVDSGGAPEAAPEPTPEPFRGGVNVYRRSPFTVHGEPLTPAPVSEDHHLDTSAPIGTEACYVLRTVISTDPLVESEATDELCLEVRDIVAPAAPLGVAAVETEAGIEVSWSPSQEPDLASYRVHRAVRGGPSEPVGEAPSSASVFLDATPREGPLPGGRPGRGAVFVYTVTAVDTAGNESAPSDPAQVRLP
jgi:hypothetical protein